LQELTANMVSAYDKVAPNTVWLHYKGHRYRVITLAYNEEDLDVVVVYEPLSRPGVVFVRSLAGWLEVVDLQQSTQRFTLVDGDV
jgi:hypothetical protein